MFAEIAYREFASSMVKTDMNRVFKVEGWGDHWLITLFDLCHLVTCKYKRPIVQSIVSLTTSLRSQLIKYMPTTLTNTLLFIVRQCEYLLHCIRFNSVFASCLCFNV